jgi:glycosyltransferase involved in cell wall biosynthesis
MSTCPEGKPKKVAVIYHYFAHYREPIFLELIKNSRHDYEFLAGDHSFSSGIKLIEDLPDNRLKKASCFFIGPLLIQFGAVKAALSSRYDTLILLGNSKWPTTWLAAILGKLRGKHVLFWSHGWLTKEHGIKGWIRNTFYKQAHGLLLYGHRSKCIGIGNGFDPSTIHVIYNSLDCDKQDQARAKIKPEDRNQTRQRLFGDDAPNPILVNVTRLHHYKKMDMLIRAAHKLNEQGSPTNVLIIGEGPHKPELEALAKELNVNAVFTGALYDELEIGQMLNASDLAVMPGPVGLLVMHALAYGVPVISNNDYDTQMPEFEAINAGVSGDFFENDNLDSLVESIKRSLATQPSFDERCQKTRETIERFYNPISERKLIDRAVDGLPADDLFNAGLCYYSEDQQ